MEVHKAVTVKKHKEWKWWKKFKPNRFHWFRKYGIKRTENKYVTIRLPGEANQYSQAIHFDMTGNIYYEKGYYKVCNVNCLSELIGIIKK